MSSFLFGMLVGGVVVVGGLLALGRWFLPRRAVPMPPAAPHRGGAVRRTPLETRESALAILNPDDPARRRAVPHAPRKET